MKFKILENVIGSLKAVGKTHFVYLNPKSQELKSKEDSKWNRAILDKSGDMYMEAKWCGNESIFDGRWSGITHDDLLKFLHENGKCKSVKTTYIGDKLDWTEDKKGFLNAVFVQRYADTLDFYLAESYTIKITKKLQDNIKKIYYQAKKKNRFINFHMDNIRVK